MALLSIRTYPDEVLRKKAQPVEAVDEELLRLKDDMVETMFAAPGIGLAAPQVGVSKRLIVLSVPKEDGGQYPLIALANPVVVSTDGETEFEEGCLSLPGFTTTIRRPDNVTVTGLGMDGKKTVIEAQGLLAVVLQHEIDHLEGVIILDKTGALKREFYKKRIRKSLAKTG